MVLGYVSWPWMEPGTALSPLSSCVDTTQALSDDPSTVNKAAESDGWFAKFKVRACRDPRVCVCVCVGMR